LARDDFLALGRNLDQGSTHVYSILVVVNNGKFEAELVPGRKKPLSIMCPVLHMTLAGFSDCRQRSRDA
jgi:hypothetical protein